MKTHCILHIPGTSYWPCYKSHVPESRHNIFVMILIEFFFYFVSGETMCLIGLYFHRRRERQKLRQVWIFLNVLSLSCTWALYVCVVFSLYYWLKTFLSWNTFASNEDKIYIKCPNSPSYSEKLSESGMILKSHADDSIFCYHLTYFHYTKPLLSCIRYVCFYYTTLLHNRKVYFRKSLF